MEKLEMLEKVRYCNRCYMSTRTGECVETHKEAMLLFNEGHDIQIMEWSDVLDQWVCRMIWEH